MGSVRKRWASGSPAPAPATGIHEGCASEAPKIHPKSVKTTSRTLETHMKFCKNLYPKWEDPCFAPVRCAKIDPKTIKMISRSALKAMLEVGQGNSERQTKNLPDLCATRRILDAILDAAGSQRGAKSTFFSYKIWKI